MSKYNCPLCGKEMTSVDGESIHLGNTKYGVTIFCHNKECPAQEVSGHGNNLKDAYEVVIHKFGKLR